MKCNFFATFFCFFALVACLFKDKDELLSKAKKRSHANFRFAWLLILLKMLFLHFRYSVYSLVGVYIESPVYLIIG